MFEKLKTLFHRKQIEEKKEIQPPVIITIHGYGRRCKHEFDNLKLWGEKDGYEVITFDMYDLFDEYDCNPKKWVARAKQQVDAFANSNRDIYLVGFSMGGVIASYLATVCRIKKLILLAPAFQYINLDTVTDAIMKSYASLVGNEKKDEIPMPKSFYTAFTEIVKNHKHFIEDVPCPILMLHGDEDEVISEINKEFAGIDSLYIADGHHRAASAVKVGLKRREQNPGYTGEEEFNYFLSVVFPYDQLCILPYNRIVKDLNGLTVKAFLGALKFNFELMLMPGFPCKPVEKHCMGMYVDGQWYHLKAWPDIYEKKDVVGQLDVSILQEKVLRPVLGIEDPRTDKRISFVGGSHKAAELAEIADRTGGVAFVMYPTSMEDLMKIADENKLMPPKSTWFEPKLRSGLFIHKL